MKTQKTALVLKHPVILLAILAALIWALGSLVGALSPILSPFLLAVILAYIGKPVVETLEKKRVPRAIGATLVILGFVALVVALIMVLVPLVQHELALLGQRLPQMLARLSALLTEKMAPWAAQRLGLDLPLDLASLADMLKANGPQAKTLARKLLVSIGSSGAALIGMLSTLLIAPLVMFYVLRDWNDIGARGIRLIPRPALNRTLRIASTIDSVLAEFLRGQLLVMLSLALYYSLALYLCGMDYALPVGLLTGLLVFVPYVGYAGGLTLAMLVSLQQGWPVWGLVLLVFGVGQVLESFVLTPRLVGERIGLHPVAVIFALMAFGEFFGFIGVLIALPASAVLLVAIREARVEYFESDFYKGKGAS